MYFTDWEHASPYVSGFSAAPGITTHKRFQREVDALDHCRKFSGLALANYVLIDDRPSLAVPLGLLVSNTLADGVGTASEPPPALSTRVDPADPDGNAYTRALSLSHYMAVARSGTLQHLHHLCGSTAASGTRAYACARG